VIAPPRAFFRLIKLLVVGRQRAQFVKVTIGSDEEVFVALVDRGKVPHKIPDVRPNPELVDFADVNRDTHGRRPHYNDRVLRRIAISMVFLLVPGRMAFADANAVLIFSFENLSNDRTLDWIGEGIAELI